MRREADGTRFRLLGIGVSNFAESAASETGDLLATKTRRLGDAEPAIDKLRQRFGHDAVVRGLAFQSDGES